MTAASIPPELTNWSEEKRSAYLYKIVSDTESGTPRQVLFLQLAEEAEKQAALWAAEAQKTGVAVPSQYAPDLRTRIVGRLLRRLGPRPLKSVLAAMKVRGMSIYGADRLGHPLPATVEDVGRRHKGMREGSNLRAAVFGASDGLVSNASLIAGVAGASGETSTILLTGIAGLLAGAFSMAAGEYLSTRSQREMYEYQIGLERDELKEYPAEEAVELSLIFAARGVPREEAEHLARTIIADPDRALATLAREELGLNPDELGSPWGAAAFSFFSFSAGALVPVLPFMAGSGQTALWSALVLTAVALFAVGAAISLFTGRHTLLGGLRMLAIGAAAGGATYLIGSALGVVMG